MRLLGVGPNPISLVSLKEEEIRTCTHREKKDHMNTQGEKTQATCKPRREASGEINSADNLISEL